MRAGAQEQWSVRRPLTQRDFSNTVVVVEEHHEGEESAAMQGACALGCQRVSLPNTQFRLFEVWTTSPRLLKRRGKMKVGV